MPWGGLWLAVIVSAVVVFLLSSFAHMVLKHHTHDVQGLANEDAIGEAVRKEKPGPGVYFIPYCPDPSKMKDPAVIKKFEEGPVGVLTLLRNGIPKLPLHLVQWFLFCLLVSFFVAYVARHTLSSTTDSLTVMRITGTVAIAGYTLGYLQDSIWKGIPWSNSVRAIVDGIAYGLATSLVFRFLWPTV